MKCTDRISMDPYISPGNALIGDASIKVTWAQDASIGTGMAQVALIGAGMAQDASIGYARNEVRRLGEHGSYIR
jgi:hypothetical protein